MTRPDDDPYFITPEEEAALEAKAETRWPIEDEGYLEALDEAANLEALK